MSILFEGLVDDVILFLVHLLFQFQPKIVLKVAGSKLAAKHKDFTVRSDSSHAL